MTQFLGKALFRRRKDTEKREIIASLLKSGHSYSEIQGMTKCSRHLIADVAKEKTETDHYSLIHYK